MRGAVVLLIASFMADSAFAEGALYVAVPSSSLRDGFAYGLAYDHPSTQVAEDQALKKCEEKTKEYGVNARCISAGTFRRRCAAIAMDGTNRWAGWGIGDTAEAASKVALAACTKGAPSCEVADVECDKK